MTDNLRQLICDVLIQATDKSLKELSVDSLLQSGVIDSLTVLAVVNGLEERLDIEFDEDDLEVANFDSINRIESLIRKKYL